ncbi:hypothetical protein NUW54_g12855 [Trametes sanguinea]|uniref:Uncharacterized protein n=1 Tax=Trametes sanguinea TaxID=158606 RepID=A0ACC1MST6_9APHY|nr:hypothetical protein NUW54_g12855 [Trametes sanguinea]
MNDTLVDALVEQVLIDCQPISAFRVPPDTTWRPRTFCLLVHYESTADTDVVKWRVSHLALPALPPPSRENSTEQQRSRRENGARTYNTRWSRAGSCAGCQKDGSLFVDQQRCSKCNLTRYCSLKCQADDLPRHEPTCKQIHSVQFERRELPKDEDVEDRDTEAAQT